MVDERVRGRWKGKREERIVPSPVHTHLAPLDKKSRLRTGLCSSGTVWGVPCEGKMLAQRWQKPSG